jgi:hypothetical protein
MADVTITTEEPAGDSTGVAAGMAMAVAGQAAEDAEVAVAEAEQANETAAVAVGVSDDARELAYDARADVAALRGEFTTFAERLEAALAARPAEPAVVEATEPAPEPAPVDGATDKTSKPKGDKGSEGETKSPKYGSRLYWGDR